MPEDSLDAISEQIETRNYDSPPLHLWDPPLSGDICIQIGADGTWYHEGSEIKRGSLRNLFASILRREDDGEYYLVTPAEKWRISVTLHPLIVTDVNRAEEGSILLATLNTGRVLPVGGDTDLFLEQQVGGVAAIHLPNGLSALFSRAAWYRLVELAETRGSRIVVTSGPFEYDLGADFGG